MTAKILVLGAGKMGSALIEGWLADGVPPEALHVVDPDAASLPAGWPAAVSVSSNVDRFHGEQFETLVLAVKPQIFGTVLDQSRRFDHGGLTVLSIAAGIRLARLDAAFPNAQCVRAMPNTPASVKSGVTVCVGTDVSESSRALVDQLMQAVGAVVWIDNEDEMDAVTAVSGSGPAYVFHMVEALAEAGQAAGLSEKIAEDLARQTVVGAGALLAASTETAAKLRENVTSPGGTTAAGLAELRDTRDLERLLIKTVLAAKARSEELS